MDPCSYARVSRLCTDVLGLPGEMFRCRFIDVDFQASTIHNALRVRVRIRVRVRVSANIRVRVRIGSGLGLG